MAIHSSIGDLSLDCFAMLAMTKNLAHDLFVAFKREFKDRCGMPRRPAKTVMDLFAAGMAGGRH